MSNFIFRVIQYPKKWESISNIYQNIFNACLAKKSSCSPFYHPIFLNAAQKLPKPQQPTQIVIGTKEGKPVFALPIKSRSLFLGKSIMEIWGGPGFDYLEPLDASSGNLATKVFLELGLHELNISLLIGKNVNKEFANLGLAKKYSWAQRSFRCPYLPLPTNEKYLLYGEISSGFRKSIRQIQRKVKENNIRFRIITEADGARALENALGNLFSLHEARAEDVGRQSKFIQNSTQHFYIKICHQAMNWPGVVHFFELFDGDRVVSSLFGYLVEDRFLFFQSGFNPDYADFSPGTLTIYKSMCYLVQQGAKEFDFLRGADEYKFRWTSKSREIFLMTIGEGIAGLSQMNIFRIRRAMHRYGRLTGLRKWLKNED